jgi:hypothetical protein
MDFLGNYYWGGAREEGYNHGACSNGMDCAVIVGRNMFWDIKDFNWLHALQKSPNFATVDMSTANADEAICMGGLLLNTTGITLDEECADLNTLVTEEEYSEDEL